MSKQTQPPPSSVIASSQAERTRHVRLSAQFSYVTQPLGEARLSVDRAEVYVARCKDHAARLRRRHCEARARTAEAIGDAAVRRQFLADQREIDRGIERFWRRFRTKARRDVKRYQAESKARRSLAPTGSVRLQTYSGPIIDSLGRRGVYMDVIYHGARRTRVGIARRLIVYITREDALERDADGNAIILSNAGIDPNEQAMAFDLIETLNRAAQGDAKVVFSMIINLPNDVSAEARREILSRFCHEAFELHDLPFVATVHEPSKEGDQRNKHAHVVFALRPLRRIADYEWEAGRELRTEFDCRERFGYYRKLFAETMTEVSQAEGKRRVYTHLSNVDRGLKNKPLTKLGAAKTAMVRRGVTVSENDRNIAEIANGELVLSEDRSARRHERAQARIDDLRAVRDSFVDLVPLEISNRGQSVALISNKSAALPLVPTRAREPLLRVAAVGGIDRSRFDVVAIDRAIDRQRMPAMVRNVPINFQRHEPAAIKAPVADKGKKALATSQERLKVPGKMSTSHVITPLSAPRVAVRIALYSAFPPPRAAAASRPPDRPIAIVRAAKSLIDRPINSHGRPSYGGFKSTLIALPISAVDISRRIFMTDRLPAIAINAVVSKREVARRVEFAMPFAELPSRMVGNLSQTVAKKSKVARLGNPEPAVAINLDGMLEVQRQFEESVACRREAKIAKRRAANLKAWTIGGNGMG